MKKLLFVLLLHTSLSAAISLDAMSDEVKKACGIEKLSKDEQTALQNWLSAQSAPKPVSPAPGKINHGKFKIAEIKDLGHFVVLENGVSYDIYSRSRKKTMAWKVGDIVDLVEPIKPKSFKMTNTAKKETVSAKAKL